eukprot:2559648-Amphidinium_carterae.1
MARKTFQVEGRAKRAQMTQMTHKTASDKTLKLSEAPRNPQVSNHCALFGSNQDKLVYCT